MGVCSCLWCGVSVPGLVHCSFAAVASESRVFESVGMFLYHCLVSEVVKRFSGVSLVEITGVRSMQESVS